MRSVIYQLVLLLIFSFVLTTTVYAAEKEKNKEGIISLHNGDLKIHAGTLFTLIPTSYGDLGRGVRLEFKVGDNGQPILVWVAPLYAGRDNSWSVLVGAHLNF